MHSHHPPDGARWASTLYWQVRDKRQLVNPIVDQVVAGSSVPDRGSWSGTV
jgi:hypothetical protein